MACTCQTILRTQSFGFLIFDSAWVGCRVVFFVLKIPLGYGLDLSHGNWVKNVCVVRVCQR